MSIGQFMPMPAAGSPGASIVFIAAASTAVSSTNHNFGALFTPVVGDLIIVGASARGAVANTSISSVTIGDGTSALVANAGSAPVTSCIASRVIQSGDTGNIKVTTGNNAGRVHVCVMVIRRYITSTHHDMEAKAASSGTSAFVNVDIPAKGVCFFYAGGSSNAAISWSSSIEVCDDVIGGDTRGSGSWLSSEGGVSGYGETSSWSGSRFNTIVAASWR